MRMNVLLILFIFGLQTFAQQMTEEMIRDSLRQSLRQSDEIQTAVQAILAELAECDQRDSGYPLCDGEVAEITSLSYLLQNNQITGLDDEMNNLLREYGVDLANRNPITTGPDYQSYQLRGQRFLSISFSDSTSFEVDHLLFKGEQNTQCRPQDPALLSSRLRDTSSKMQSLTAEQRVAWFEFCRTHRSYETESGRCPAGLEWKEKMANTFCAGSGEHGFPLFNAEALAEDENFGLPPAFTFLFDGFRAFDPQNAADHAENITGDETSHFTRLREREDQRGTHASEYSLINAYIQTVSEPFGEQSPQLFYYDGSGLRRDHNEREALACFQDIQGWMNLAESLVPSLQRPQNIVMGYSNGGATALRMQEEMGRQGHQIDLLITVDPIERHAGFLASQLTNQSLLPERHPNTARHINLFQSVDQGSLQILGGINLRSDAIASADENISLNELAVQREELAHGLILRMGLLRYHIACEIASQYDEGELRATACTEPEEPSTEVMDK